MTLNTAANHLLAIVDLPPGTANVLPIQLEKGGKLVVWVDKKFIRSAQKLPHIFEGYEVIIETRPEISTSFAM